MKARAFVSPSSVSVARSTPQLLCDLHRHRGSPVERNLLCFSEAERGLPELMGPIKSTWLPPRHVPLIFPLNRKHSTLSITISTCPFKFPYNHYRQPNFLLPLLTFKIITAPFMIQQKFCV